MEKLKGTWGIEIETSVDYSFIDSGLHKILPSWEMHEDGSISSRSGRAIEIVSDVYNDKEYMIKDVLKLKGHLMEANKSMGIHIHFKPENTHYSTFSNTEFIRFFQDKIKSKFVTMSKERGVNRFCRFLEDNDLEERDIVQEQINAMGKHDCRYRAINFCANTHKTIEFRIFKSTINVHKIKSYINFLYNTLNEFYAMHQKGLVNKEIKTELMEDEGLELIEVKAGLLWD